MKLGLGFIYDNFYNPKNLSRLDYKFTQFIKTNNFNLFEKVIYYRSNVNLITKNEYSSFLIEIAELFEKFFQLLFCLENDLNKIQNINSKFAIIYQCKRSFVQRRALKKYSKKQAEQFDQEKIIAQMEKFFSKLQDEYSLAKQILIWTKDIKLYRQEIEIAEKYAALMSYSINKSVLFSYPQKIDTKFLINNGEIQKHKQWLRHEFNYEAGELNALTSMDNAYYCIYCHHQNKDSCRHGLDIEKKKGCPLKQKISEMNEVKSHGFNLAALAIIMIDNPLVAATGYRICNDCRISCIFQNQIPVNVPVTESEIFRSVLNLPYGFEIYYLLTLWNPLNIWQPLPSKSSLKKIFIVGLGPAGFSLSYYLLRSGHTVKAIDRFEITEISKESISKPIYNWQDYSQKLSERIPKGFGGVIEYGITPRWDKNILDLIQIILLRNSNFQIESPIKFGQDINFDNIFSKGFDYLALAYGAGEAKISEKINCQIKGVMFALDFLIKLQNHGAFLKGNLSNLSIQLPIVVVGGGLTAIDAAVEALYYYIYQVEEIYYQFKHKINDLKNLKIKPEGLELEFFKHGEKLSQTKNIVEKIQIIQQFGGVRICYRGNLSHSPAYRQNSEELNQALAAGVKFSPNMDLEFIGIDDNQISFITFKHGNEEIILKVKTLIVAYGTQDIDCSFLKKSNYSKRIGYYGDIDPKYAGSVVKAIASSKEGYPKINQLLNETD